MITFRDVAISYKNSAPVLQNLSFEIAKGEQVGLVGANGTGKSTLMRAAVGLLSAEGTISVGGTAVSQKNLAEIRKRIGYVVQDSDNQLFMSTVLEDMIFGPMNYGMSKEEAVSESESVLERLGISKIKDRYNHTLSGGEKKLAALAVILAMKPDTLLLDEPSAALDPYNRRQLISELNSLPMTKLVASHDLDFILETCDRVILLGEKGIVADGPAGEILRDEELLLANHLELPLCMQGLPAKLR